jgi:biotin transport system ATP-binding protein/energy-coupling factor transport system ATP-binding protein
MISLRGVRFSYDSAEEPTLTNLNLEIHEGEYLAIVGPNACGKTTLLKHLNGLLVPGEGEVWVDDLTTKDPRSAGRIRQRVGLVFQNPDSQIVGMTVEEDLAFGPGNLGFTPEKIRKKVDEVLHLLGIEKLAPRAPHTLSGGEKRLLAIGGVLAMAPAYIALDEPTSSLDPRERRRILAILKALHGMGMAVVHITHDMDEIVDAERVVVMLRGSILCQGSPAQVFSAGEELARSGLEIPKVTELIRRLREGGVAIRPDIFRAEDACRELLPLLNGREPRIFHRGEG